MAYTLPQFNVPVDVWSAGHVPSEDDPDFENVASQFYVYSRVSFDVQPCELELYHPALQVRMPLAALLAWREGQVFEIPAESGRYYRARWKDRVHLGFPNEYLVAFIVQCRADGLAMARDIEGAVPCGEPEPATHFVVGEGFLGIQVDSDALALRNPVPGEHHASGEGEIEIDVGGEGEADKTDFTHSATGAGEIEITVAGAGDAERIV